jgi:hypothetical protein
MSQVDRAFRSARRRGAIQRTRRARREANDGRRRPWPYGAMRSRPVVVIALAIGLASCGGAVASDAVSDAASGPGDRAPEDATLPQDSAGDAPAGRTFAEGSAADVAAVSGDASLADVQRDPSDAGEPLVSCEEDAAVDGGCACAFGDAQSWCTVSCDSLYGTACGTNGLRCGFGCGPNCDCIDGSWWCIAPPCIPPVLGLQ